MLYWDVNCHQTLPYRVVVAAATQNASGLHRRSTLLTTTHPLRHYTLQLSLQLSAMPPGMLLADYGSDSDDSGPSSPPPAPAPAAPKAAVKKRKGPVKIALDLPPAEKKAKSDDDRGRSGSADADAEEAAVPAKRKLAGAGRCVLPASGEGRD